MASVDLRFQLSHGGAKIEMMTVIDGEPKLQTFWTAEEIDDMLRILSSLRAHMSVDVSPERPMSTKMDPVTDPKIQMSKSGGDRMIVLSMRHPGLGWIDWKLSPHSLADMLSDMVGLLKT